MDDRDALRFFSGEFRCADTERAFRAAQARAELRQIRLLWSVALVCFTLYLPVDLDSNQATWGRCGVLAAGASVLLLLSFPYWQARRDQVSSVGLLLALSCYGAVLGARDQGPGALLLLLLGSYLFSPCRFSLHCVTGLLGSAVAVVAAAGAVGPLDVSYLVPANLLAMLALAQANRGRRRLYRQGLRLAREGRLRDQAQQQLQRLHRQNLGLLYNALPPAVARQLRENPGRRPARLVASATMVFADLVGFTPLARTLSPRELVRLLDRVFRAFDALAERHGLEKIKTVGDAYLAAAGLYRRNGKPAADAARMALAQQRVIEAIAARTGLALDLRVGLHTGPVVAGVLGSKRYAFDIWGDAVNVASRLQTAAPPGGILVSTAARRACGSGFRFGEESRLPLKGCGDVSASLLYGLQSARRSASRAAVASADCAATDTVISAKRS